MISAPCSAVLPAVHKITSVITVRAMGLLRGM